MYIKKFLLTVYISLVSEICLPQTHVNVKDMQLKIDNLQSQIQEIKNFDETRFNSISQLVSQSSSNISNVLETFSICFAIFSIVGGGLFAWYLSAQVKRADNAILKADKAILEFKQLRKDLEEFIQTNNSKLYNRFIEADTKDMLERLAEDPQNITNVFNIFAVRKIVGPDNWQLIKNSFVKYSEVYTNFNNDFIISQYAALIMQHYPEKLADINEDQIVELIHKYRIACKSCGFLSSEIIQLINEFSNTQNSKLLEILVDSVLFGNTFLIYYQDITGFKENAITLLKQAITRNEKLKSILNERKEALGNTTVEPPQEYISPVYNRSMQQEVLTSILS